MNIENVHSTCTYINSANIPPCQIPAFDIRDHLFPSGISLIFTARRPHEGKLPGSITYPAMKTQTSRDPI
ncbi:hypothetical protein M413DRAFT_119138 [Hebeloma cylindrosporum]|uniref:Uncharacterized protein n=1 Tax=Hebeloma cylindrosporum TaxID=76867 RepID=A0A0C3D1A2_HEBCY|nr:hypothetical protein M413DRAFT_119138 [Hebeloma cylindrosporum h7]